MGGACLLVCCPKDTSTCLTAGTKKSNPDTTEGQTLLY